MPDFGIYAGDTDKTIYVRLRDATTGLAKTALAYNSAGAVCSYVLPRAARAAITLATQTVTGAHSDGGFVEVDATNCKGLYRLDLPDAAIASGAYTLISIEFDGIIEETIEIPIHKPKVDVDLIKTQAVTCSTGVTVGAYVGGTAAAALASVCTEGRLAELDAANLPTDVAAVKGDTAAILDDTGTSGVVLPQAQADKVWGTATRVLTANTNLNDPTAAAIADAVWDEAATGHTDAGKAGAQLWTDIDDILTDTAVIGAAGAGLTAVPWNAAWDAEVQSEVVDALTAEGYTAARAAFLDKLNVTGTLLHSAYTIADADSLTANSIPDHLRKMSWFTFNQLDVLELDGTFSLKKDDASTPAATGSITSAAGTTTRSAPTWA